jgi:putative transposase
MIDDEKNNDDEQDDEDLVANDLGDADDEELDDDYLGTYAGDDDPETDALVDDMMNDRGSVSLCFFHIYFSTAAQRPLFDDAELQSEVQHELARVCKRLCCPEYGISVGVDHAHVVCRLHPELSFDGLVNRLKGDSQAWLLGRAPELGPVIWQKSYGGYSVGGEDIGALRHYLEEETQRHTIESYEDEFRRLCAENEIEIEEPDCWQ